MTRDTVDHRQAAGLRLGFAELAGLTAAVMALNALAIDMMLPALGMIGDDLGVVNDNDRQLVIGVYIIANGIAQLFFGPLVDRFGRRLILFGALGGYLVGNLLSVMASDFSLLLAARAFQGVATAGARVAIIAVVRDNYAGRRMARVISFAVTIFMAAPIVAPAIGQLILFAFPWRGVFLALFFYGACVLAWSMLRVGESPAPRTPLRLDTIASSYWQFATDRCAMGYTVASALCFGALFGFINSAEQVFLEIFELGPRFPIAFAVVAGAFGAATFINARFVERHGMRRLSHLALIGFLGVSLANWASAAWLGDSLWRFLGLTAPAFFAIGLIGPNASAIALERMGHIAGSAAAANGFASTTIAGVLGVFVGRAFDGTTAPVAAGFAILGACALGVVLWTENGRLFAPGETGASGAGAAAAPGE